MQKVVFAIPSYNRTPCLEFLNSSLDTNDLLTRSGITTVWRSLGGDPYVHKARNRLASEFLAVHQDATDFFFLDDDLGWEADAVLRMLLRDEDVIVGVYPKKSEDENWPVQISAGAIEKGGLYKADLAPTGFMRIKRHVLEKAAEISGRYPEEDLVKGQIHCRDFFRTGFVAFEPDGMDGRWWGEDYFFSAMITIPVERGGLGMEVWVDPDISFTHRGSHLWRGRFRNALEDKILELNGGRKYLEDTPAIRRWGEPSDLGALVSMAFDAALAGQSELPEEVLQMEGMVGRRYRMFINNLMRSLDDPRYLEIGSYKGASVIAACHGVGPRALARCIDDFSMFGGPREEFLDNTNGLDGTLILIEEPFQSVDYQYMGHNVFFYDGPHAEKDQYAAMTLAHPALDDEYVLIVDDWNWKGVRNGTMSGLRDSGQEIVSAIELRTVNESNPLTAQCSDWHNGYLIAVVRKAAAEMQEAAE